MSESNVVTVEKKVIVTKEANDIFEAAEGLAVDIKAKKPIAEIVAGNLSKLMNAVDGYEKVSGEAKSEHFYETVALGGARIAKALISQKEA